MTADDPWVDSETVLCLCCGTEYYRYFIAEDVQDENGDTVVLREVIWDFMEHMMVRNGRLVGYCGKCPYDIVTTRSPRLVCPHWRNAA